MPARPPLPWRTHSTNPKADRERAPQTRVQLGGKLMILAKTKSNWLKQYLKDQGGEMTVARKLMVVD